MSDGAGCALGYSTEGERLKRQSDTRRNEAVGDCIALRFTTAVCEEVGCEESSVLSHV